MKFNKYKDKMGRMSNQPFDSRPHNIIVTNIPKNLSSREIMETFRFMGNILRADIMLTSKGEHSGCACLTFPDYESAAFAASRYDGGMLNNQKIKMFVE
ncbi:RNA binding protein [Plasmodium vivax India VII]|uniref:RNA binding protein, putative n=5 Tax=Plasmodium vivax TaxID=5855 RepID=A5K5X9_PLAVS|nr:RNA binding protein, putative [Plasmodium vivax]EDL45314.1 RNA binding protein, putative [Plasmodium vivax]KMZ81903.1 RNA binding protein [Plasmodium vivax India VII]KMZ88189.1 RNA binding protein [Plasmodium vivax Brazil I]KMZ94564.1 RNA binding protein [Plasmodium vivax Mauritania I]|eukprot:XP_001615041.1 RNA binding protein [Plasmodium vivax Sal-1]